MTVVFPGLSCDMVLVVAGVGSAVGYGSTAAVVASSARPSDGTVVGGWSINPAVTGCSGFRPYHQFPCSSSSVDSLLVGN